MVREIPELEASAKRVDESAKIDVTPEPAKAVGDLLDLEPKRLGLIGRSRAEQVLADLECLGPVDRTLILEVEGNPEDVAEKSTGATLFHAMLRREILGAFRAPEKRADGVVCPVGEICLRRKAAWTLIPRESKELENSLLQTWFGRDRDEPQIIAAGLKNRRRIVQELFPRIPNKVRRKAALGDLCIALDRERQPVPISMSTDSDNKVVEVPFRRRPLDVDLLDETARRLEW
jgi:hypothetical protein